MKIVCFIFALFLVVAAEASADLSSMKAYCTAKNPKVSFPLPGQPEIIKSPDFEEAYIFRDTTNINSYQFTYKQIDKSINAKEYLESVITGRVRSVNAVLMSKKIYKAGNKTIANYSYHYYAGNTNKVSYVKAVITNGLYYSWAVQSYEGSSAYSADYIFTNYSKYVDNDGGLCR